MPTTVAPTYSVLRVCSNRGGYEADPETRLTLHLDDVEAKLGDAGHETLQNAGILLVARVGDVDVSVFESGKLLFKTPDLPTAEAGMRAFCDAMGWSA